MAMVERKNEEAWAARLPRPALPDDVVAALATSLHHYGDEYAKTADGWAVATHLYRAATELRTAAALDVELRAADVGDRPMRCSVCGYEDAVPRHQATWDRVCPRCETGRMLFIAPAWARREVV